MKVGQTVYGDVDDIEETLTIYFRKSDYEKARKETTRFRKMVRDFNERYKDILDQLKNK